MKFVVYKVNELLMGLYKGDIRALRDKDNDLTEDELVERQKRLVIKVGVSGVHSTD